MRSLALKRMMDVVGSTVGLVLTAPAMVAIAALVRLKLGSPVLFRQERPGFRERPFVMFKFRTMRDALDSKGEPLPDGERLTPFGSFLRGTSLDELPELLNVLRGEMSLVGPRPLLTEYLSRYDEKQRRRHDVKPGITGWTAVNGRNALDWDEKFDLDSWYVDHWSNELDVKILLQTLVAVLKREGIDHSSGVPMPKFEGNRRERRPHHGEHA
jgi:sugar transferase EpsL